jgi:hypothetical protein
MPRSIAVLLILCASPAMAERSPPAKPLPGWYLANNGVPPVYFRPYRPRKLESTRDLILRMQRPGPRDRME